MRLKPNQAAHHNQKSLNDEVIEKAEAFRALSKIRHAFAGGDMDAYTYGAFAKMAEAFIIPPDRSAPRLPLSEYIVTSGYHKIAQNSGAYLKSNLDMQNNYHAKWVLPNGKSVTAISGPLFHCHPDAPYEVWLQDSEDEPRGFQTDEDLLKLLIQEQMK